MSFLFLGSERREREERTKKTGDEEEERNLFRSLFLSFPSTHIHIKTTTAAATAAAAAATRAAAATAAAAAATRAAAATAAVAAAPTEASQLGTEEEGKVFNLFPVLDFYGFAPASFCCCFFWPLPIDESVYFSMF